MPNVTPKTLRQLQQQILFAMQGEQWQELKRLDLSLRTVLRTCQSQPSSPAIKAELSQLKQCHQQAVASVTHVRNNAKDSIDSASEQKERILAYQLAMNME